MKVGKAYFLGVDGSMRRLTELEGKELSLREMYPFVGNGCDIIEHVGLKKGVDMWVDEEGLLKDGFVLNHNATTLYRRAYPKGGFPGESSSELAIVGNAIVTDNTKAGTFMSDNFVGNNSFQV